MFFTVTDRWERRETRERRGGKREIVFFHLLTVESMVEVSGADANTRWNPCTLH